MCSVFADTIVVVVDGVPSSSSRWLVLLLLGDDVVVDSERERDVDDNCVLIDVINGVDSPTTGVLEDDSSIFEEVKELFVESHLSFVLF